MQQKKQRCRKRQPLMFISGCVKCAQPGSLLMDPLSLEVLGRQCKLMSHFSGTNQRWQTSSITVTMNKILLFFSSIKGNNKRGVGFRHGGHISNTCVGIHGDCTQSECCNPPAHHTSSHCTKHHRPFDQISGQHTIGSAQFQQCLPHSLHHCSLNLQFNCSSFDRYLSSTIKFDHILASSCVMMHVVKGRQYSHAHN